MFVGGVAEDGTIAYNEPGSSLASRSRIKIMTDDNIIGIAKFFKRDESEIPKNVMTVGVGTIMNAKSVLIIISGRHKARALHEAIENGVNHIWTISCLQLHPHGIIVCDDAATDEMEVKTVNYFKDIEKQ